VSRPADAIRVILQRGIGVAALAAGCSSGHRTASSSPASTPLTAPAIATTTTPTRCDVRKSAIGARNVLGLVDLGSRGGRGITVTDVDYRGCAAATAALGWRCDMAFPWQTASSTGTAMATLAVRDARVAYIVMPDRDHRDDPRRRPSEDVGRRGAAKAPCRMSRPGGRRGRRVGSRGPRHCDHGHWAGRGRP
jgi:hypothetical protein